MAKRFLALDPGLTGTGYCYVVEAPGNPAFGFLRHDYKHGNFRTLKPKKFGLQERIDFLCGQLGDFLVDKVLAIQEVVIEQPSLWSASALSHASASKGDLFALAMLIGAFQLICSQHQIPCRLISVQAWKGTMTKDATRARLERNLQTKFDSRASTHEIDALGLAMFVAGKF